MPKVSSKGQITFPSRWKKFMGGIAIGEWLFFHIQHADQIVYVTKEGDSFQSSAPLLGQNFLTIPNEIRKWFRLQPGDDLEFGYDPKREAVFFKKKQNLLTCPICGDAGSINGHPCIVCRETGTIEKEHWLNETTRLMMRSRRYGVMLSILNHDVDPESNEIRYFTFPVIRLESREYPKELLDVFHDYYQNRAIKETIETEKLDTTDLEEFILSLLITDDEKDRMRVWLSARAV